METADEPFEKGSLHRQRESNQRHLHSVFIIDSGVSYGRNNPINDVIFKQLLWDKEMSYHEFFFTGRKVIFAAKN